MTKAKTKNILQEATEIKNYIEKNHKLPLTCTINNVQFSIYSTTYLMSLALQDKFKHDEYKLHSVVKYRKNKHTDTIKEKIGLEEYKFMVDKFIKFCNENNRVPTYVTTKKSRTQVSFELYTYCISKILVWYKNNKTLPNYCKFNKSDLKAKSTTKTSSSKTTSTTTSTTKNTETSKKSISKKVSNVVKKTVSKITKYVQTNLLENTGCSGMGQCTPYYCSCNALQQMFYKLTGILVPEKTIAKWAGVTTAGVGHAGIETAVAKFNKTYNKNLKVTWKNFSDLGSTTTDRYTALGKLFTKAKTAVFFHLCYRRKYGHYEPAKTIDLKNSMLVILNSLGTKNSDGSYQGYHENRSFTEQSTYISMINQKSVCIIEA